MLACSAAEGVPVEKLLRQNLTESEIFTPNQEYADIYQSKFETYRQIYPVLKSFWKT
jgi:sugar (pentulose or hexulose) kinase